MSKHIPILFSTAMVQAILDGRKTQTRRVVKPQPPSDSDYLGTDTDRASGVPVFYACWESDSDFHNIKCPYGQPGDVLWVRETFFAYGYWFRENENSRFEFRDITLDPVLGVGSYQYMDSIPSLVHIGKNPGAIGWHKRPSIFMPKEACRIFLKVISGRVERLQNISEQDAIAEGINMVGSDLEFGGVQYPGIWYENYGKEGYSFLKPQDSFCSLWQTINTGKPSDWHNNPWVWVVEFKRIEKPEDFA